MLFNKPPKKTPELNEILDNHIGKYVKSAAIKNIMMATILAISAFVMVKNLVNDNEDTEAFIAVIRIDGEIAQGKQASASVFAKALEKASLNEHTKAIVILANSPGGSPVMAESINGQIIDYKQNRQARETAKEKLKADFPNIGDDGQQLRKLPDIIVSIEDVCASACLASIASADTIYSHENSLVGSIGIRMDSFGVDGLLQKVGVERQVLTSGRYKDLTDPYRTMSETEKSFIREQLLNPLHMNFIALMKTARGSKLSQDENTLFSGMIWSGEQAQQLGLVDEIMTTERLLTKLKEKHKTKNIKMMINEPFSIHKLISASISNGISESLNASTHHKIQ